MEDASVQGDTVTLRTKADAHLDSGRFGTAQSGTVAGT